MKNSQRIILFLLVMFLCIAIPTTLQASDQSSPRGKYVYDDANRLSIESRAAVSNLLWRIDVQTNYEFIVVFPNNTMTDTEIIDWFNAHGVGKKGADTGAALFMFKDGKSFLSIGSGNDVVSVTLASTYGKEILKDFDNDPTVTLIRFINLYSKQLSEKTVSVSVTQPASEWVRDNMTVIALWGAVAALALLLIEQRNGFQVSDLYAVLLIVIICGGVAAYGQMNLDTYRAHETKTTFGIIDTTSKTGPEEYPIQHHECTTDENGDAHCRDWTTTGYRYYNNVTMISYDLNTYWHRFISEGDEWHNTEAWTHDPGEVWQLTIHLQDNSVTDMNGFNDNSGGVTVGDGIWLNP
jgi:hypothetical protein